MRQQQWERIPEMRTPPWQAALISVAQANKLVPLVTKVQERVYQTQQDEFSVVRADWAKQAKADRQIGGEHWKETVRLAGVALAAGGASSQTHEFRELLDDSGIGNNPSALRVFRAMGAEIERLRNQAGTHRRLRPASREEALYPDDLPES